MSNFLTAALQSTQPERPELIRSRICRLAVTACDSLSYSRRASPMDPRPLGGPPVSEPTGMGREAPEPHPQAGLTRNSGSAFVVLGAFSQARNTRRLSSAPYSALRRPARREDGLPVGCFILAGVPHCGAQHAQNSFAMGFSYKAVVEQDSDCSSTSDATPLCGTDEHVRAGAELPTGLLVALTCTIGG